MDFFSKELKDCTWQELIFVLIIYLIAIAITICFEAWLFMLLWNALVASMSFIQAIIAAILFNLIAATVKWVITIAEKLLKKWIA